MTTTAEKYEVRGEAEALRQMLEHRFGTLSRRERALIETASLERLDAWLGRALDADSVDAVLANGTDRATH